MPSGVRGSVYNKGRYRQIVDFSGLQFERGITPTDIDGFLDFDNRLFCVIELKFMDNPVPKGQRLAIERLCRAIELADKKCLGIVASHESPPEEPIDASLALVTEYRWKSRWIRPSTKISVRAAIDLIKAHES